jgi:microcystin degradation protein MlrC
MTIADREAVDAAYRPGVGQPFDQRVGGKTDRLHGEPVRVRGRLKSLLRPLCRWQCVTVAAATGPRDLPNLTPKRVIPFGLHQQVDAGIYPERQKILVVTARSHRGRRMSRWRRALSRSIAAE